MIEAVNIVLIFFVLACAVASILVLELVSAVFILGCYSFLIAVLWALLGAVDVSFTEAVIGAGISTLFFLLAIFHTRHDSARPFFSGNVWVALGATCLLGTVLVWGSTELPLFGSVTSAPNAYLSPFYIEHSFADTQTPNIVTAVLADYRGFDTLIECAVIFTAGIACLLVMRRES